MLVQSFTQTREFGQWIRSRWQGHGVLVRGFKYTSHVESLVVVSLAVLVRRMRVSAWDLHRVTHLWQMPKEQARSHSDDQTQDKDLGKDVSKEGGQEEGRVHKYIA